MFVAPTEKYHGHLGVVSSEPEHYGVDFLWESELGLVGVQRKQFPGDFLASIDDGRLVREYNQMQGLDVRVLLLEGKWIVVNGVLKHDYGRQWTSGELQNYLMGVQVLKGVCVAQTNNTLATEHWLNDFKTWTNKPEHLSLEYRPHTNDIEFRKPNSAGERWEDIRNESYQVYFLQSLPGTGVKKAKAVIEEVGFPFRLAVSDSELLDIPGIGPKWLAKVKEVLGL